MSENTPTTLPVYYETRPVGTIEVVEGGPRFVYDQAWRDLKGAFPISLTMPLTGPIHEPKVLLPWVVNLLPESSKTLSALKGALKNQQMSGPPDVIDLLFRMGRDTAGALSIGHPGTSIVENKWRRVPDDAALERILNELPLKPFLIGDEGVSMSLAGVQTKLAVAMEGRVVHIPFDGAPSTHVLKPDSDRLPGLVQNEAFCLTLAAKAGIPTPNITTGIAGARSYLLVERYDRRHDGQRWRRLHQEDFCQALGYPPEAKYQNSTDGHRGPSLPDLVTLTQKHMRIQDTTRFVDLAIFNAIVWNTDSHAKNYSMMLSANGASMAPGYDITCAAPYPNITRNMAQKIGGQKRADQLGRRHWEKFASDCGLSPSLVVRRVREIADAVALHAHAAKAEVEAMPADGHAVLEQVVAAVTKRSAEYVSRLTDGHDVPDEPESSSSPAA
jgi:serine/threonine-protein kinase HipA